MPHVRLLALTAAIVVVVAACGSASRPTIESADPSDPFTQMPAIPTTAPIVLPPEDLELPAEAPIEVGIQLPAGLPADTPPADDDPGATAAVPGSSTDLATVEADVVQPIVSVDAWDPCIVSTAQSVGASSLLDPLAAASATDLTSQQLNSLASASVTCGIVSDSLGLTDLSAHVATGGDCMNQWLASTGGGSVFAGLSSITFGQATPTWAQGYFTESIASCFPGSAFAAEVMAHVAADASLAGAFDARCLASSFDSSGVIHAFASSLATDPDAATLSIGLSDGWVVDCASVGRMVASAAAAEGVALSASTVSCLDAELRANGLVTGLIASTADSEAVGISTIACLTSDEAAQLLG